MTAIGYANSLKALSRGARTVMVVAPQRVFTAKRFPKLLGKRLDGFFVDLAKDTSPGDLGGARSSRGPTGKDVPHELAVGVVPNSLSRHNSPTRAACIRRVVGEVASGKGKLGIVLVLDEAAHLLGAVNAIGRAFPLFSRKTGKSSLRARVQIMAVTPDGKEIELDPRALEVMEAARDSAELVDTPPTVLNPEEFAARAKKTLKALKGIKVKEIAGDKLLGEGLGGIHTVGRCAVNAPRMVVATYTPQGSWTRHVALVGKGVTYDTGGLHIKGRGNMEGMKCDMGGAAAVYGAFRALVAANCPHQVSLVLCLAENAIGPAAYKPDDVIDMHSGKTVEVNNTDAEGRLLLGDGVSYAARVLGADTVFNAATLTGAQMVATGTVHAAVVCNDEELEAEVVARGRATGDLVHPLIFAPELFRKEFKSKIADMCNSVKNRMNAQSSCAAQFVYNHLEGTKVKWCHIDLAGPAFPDDRGSGFGVALLSETVLNLT